MGDDSVSNNTEEYLEVKDGDLKFWVSKISSAVIYFHEEGTMYGSTDRHFAFQGFKPFIWKGDLYAIGGYGFWRINPFLLKHDKQHGWIPLQIKGDYTVVNPKEIVVDHDRLFLIGGDRVNENNVLDFPIENSIQVINLNNYQFQKKFNFNPHFFQINRLGTSNSHIYVFSRNKLIVLDSLLNLRVFEIDESNIDLLDPKVEVTINNSCVVWNKKRLCFGDDKPNTIFIILVLIMIIALLVISVLKTKNSKKLFTGQQEYRNYFENFELQVLMLFINRDYCDYHVLQSILPIELSASHKNRVIRDIIISLNFKLKSRLNISDEVFVRVDDNLDKRRTNYSILSKYRTRVSELFQSFGGNTILTFPK